MHLLGVQLSWLGFELPSGLLAAAELHEAAHLHWPFAASDVAIKPTPSSLQLILMLLFARGVLGAGRHLVGVLPPSARSSRGVKQDEERSGIAGLARSSSSSMGAVSGGECSSSGLRGELQKAGNSSSSSNSSGKGCSSSSMTAPEQSCSSFAGRVLGSSDNGRGSDCVCTFLMGCMVTLALKVNFCLLSWQGSVCNAEADSSPASSAEAAVGDNNGAEPGRKDASAHAAAAAGGSAASPAARSGGELPKHLAKMPAHGLPAAVVAQLDSLASKWPEAVFLENGEPAEELHPSFRNDTELLQPLLEDLLELLLVLLLEVPLPTGCNNPWCSSLEGELEANAVKMCSKCKVVGYCSRACQVAHWEAHKGVCTKLQELGGEHVESKKG